MRNDEIYQRYFIGESSYSHHDCHKRGFYTSLPTSTCQEHYYPYAHYFGKWFDSFEEFKHFSLDSKCVDHSLFIWDSCF